jgi:hypothetical protein
VGDVARVEDERRDRLGRGEAGPPSWLERSDAVEDCFFRLGVDLRLSSLNELELGMRRGAGCVWGCGCGCGCGCGVGRTPERRGKSDGDRSEEPWLTGETGAGIAASDESFRRSEKMEGSMGGGIRGGVLEGVLVVGAAVNGLEGSMAQKSVPFECLCSKIRERAECNQL